MGGNIIDFTVLGRRPKRPAGDVDAVIHQEDIEELILLGRRAHETVEAWKAKHDLLLWMALEGIPAEPGVHTLYPRLVRKRAHQVNGCTYYRLVVR